MKETIADKIRYKCGRCFENKLWDYAKCITADELRCSVLDIISNNVWHEIEKNLRANIRRFKNKEL